MQEFSVPKVDVGVQEGGGRGLGRDTFSKPQI